MSWQYVFNTDLSPFLWGGIEIVMKIARDCGYEYFTWNGWVYNVDGTPTELKTTDCF